MNAEPTRRILLLAAHSHDEFSIAATLRRHVRAGDTLLAAWFAHDDRKDVERLRRAEAIEAMRMLGVAGPSITFVPLPAEPLVVQLPEVVDAVRALAEKHGPDLVYCPAFEGGHPDHDALNFAVWEALGSQGIECREFPIYRRAQTRRFLRRLPRFGRLLPAAGEPETLALTAGEQKFKRELWKVYATQRPLFDLLLQLSGDEQRIFSSEQSRPFPMRDYERPPHERPLLYEQMAGTPYLFDEFSAMIRRYLWSGGSMAEGEL